MQLSDLPFTKKERLNVTQEKIQILRIYIVLIFGANERVKQISRVSNNITHQRPSTNISKSILYL